MRAKHRHGHLQYLINETKSHPHIFGGSAVTGYTVHPPIRLCKCTVHTEFLVGAVMSISSFNLSIYSYTSIQTSSSNSTNSPKWRDAGNGDHAGLVSGGGDGGGAKGFLSAISQALSQIGVSPAPSTDTSNSSSTSTSGSPAQVLGAFVQDLFAALQAQSGNPTPSTNTSTTPATPAAEDPVQALATTSTTPNPQSPVQALAAFTEDLLAALQAQPGATHTTGNTTGSSTTPTTPVTTAATGATGTPTTAANSPALTPSAGHGHHHHHHGASGNLESGLQSLIQQLSASTGGTSGTTTTGSSTSSPSTSGVSSPSPAIAALQQSFGNLLTADGASNSGATLVSFLQTLSQDIQGTSSKGNFVNTTS
jgi:hypothetical protein